MKPEFSWERLSRFIIKLRETVENQENRKDHEKPEGPFAPIIRKWTEDAVLFTRDELGGVLLDTDDAAEYRACVRALHSFAAGKHGQISRRAVEDAFQTAILRSLNITNNDPEPDFLTRLEREIEELKRTLRRKPETFVVRLEAQGLDLKGLPRRFGLVTFYLADENTVPTPDARGEETSDPQRLKRLESNRVLRERLRATVKGKTFGEIEVEAFDRDAAVSLAEKTLRGTIDALNYFGEFFSDMEARVFLPGDAAPCRCITVISRKAEPSNNVFAFGTKGPMGLFSFPSTNSPAKGVEAFERVSNLLASSNTSDLEDRILAALKMSGRASTDDRNDSAFLRSCISLETLLSNKDQGEITLAFSLRAVHLIFTDASMRMDWFRKMKKYYGLRSRLAHAGTADISDADVANVRLISRQAIFMMLVTEPFNKMIKADDLERWFEQQLLAGPMPEVDSVPGVQKPEPDKPTD
jgi:Apea-like HEPN